jgi:hypothetical protein
MINLDGPVLVRAKPDTPSRWLWLFKWCLLALPHYPILLLLYIAYPLLTVVAGVAILVSGRYPRAIFAFNVGVLRWSWRLMNYRFPMNATDKYPPFTLRARPDYPADLEVAYPDRLKRWPVLLKWLLGLPQYLLAWAIEPFFQLLCVTAAVALLTTGTIHQGMFDLLMGIARYRYRVAIYASLMTDEYPVFRLDQGVADDPK